MCGRFTLTQSPSAIAHNLDLSDLSAFTPRYAFIPRYNIAPTQPVMVVRMAPGKAERELTYLTWGLIPSWAKDPKIGAKLINARAETLSEKPSFRSAFKRRRCLVIADGFYEWQKQATGKQPMYFSLDRQPFGFAGLWERWQSADGSEVESCTIITTEANELMRPIHDRMPVILNPQNYDRWLDPESGSSESGSPESGSNHIQSLLCPYPTAEMSVYPVSAKVNNPRNEDADCITPIALQNSGAPDLSTAPVQNSK